jgi:hypothetical protein
MLQYFWHHTVQRREHGTENGKQTKPVQRREHRTENGNKQNLYNVGNTRQKTETNKTCTTSGTQDRKRKQTKPVQRREHRTENTNTQHKTEN